MIIPFRIVTAVGNEKKHISEAIDSVYICGGGRFENECASWFKHNLGACNVMMMAYCTHTLVKMVVLMGINGGDEVIMTSDII